MMRVFRPVLKAQLKKLGFFLIIYIERMIEKTVNMRRREKKRERILKGEKE